MLTISEVARSSDPEWLATDPGWLATAAFVVTAIVAWMGLGAVRFGRVGEWYHLACGVPLLVMVVAAGLQSVVLTMIGLAAMFALGVYGTIMRFRPQKGEQPRDEPSR